MSFLSVQSFDECYHGLIKRYFGFVIVALHEEQLPAHQEFDEQKI
jgi:hypothetical protein